MEAAAQGEQLPWLNQMVANPDRIGAAAPLAHFAAGDARGRRQDGLCIYKGIPYASPPTGARRWQPPVPLPNWTGVLEAHSSGPACIQPPRRCGSIYASALERTAENCLFLDIWAPEGAKDLPVLVWIHGGSFIWGAGSEPHHDGAELARRGAIVVTINYRLGVFGYLAHPELSAESPDGVSGNYGLLDQIAALSWVKQNIAAVGGNPDNVTIAGESAGALSVLYLMVSPLAQGLFAKAVAQSAYLVSTPALKQEHYGHEPAETAGTRLCAQLGVEDIAALRAMDGQLLADEALRAGFMPGGTIDGHILPDEIVAIFERNQQAKVQLLAGFNSGELRSLPFLIPPLPDTEEAYEREIRARYGKFSEQFLAFYPSHGMAESMLACVRDALYGWTVWKLGQAQKAAGLPFFLYYFNHSYPAAKALGLDGFHACELPYLFGTEDRTPPLWPVIPVTPDEQALSRAIGDYWVSFASNAQPQAVQAPDWPDQTLQGGFMHFCAKPELGHDLLPGRFELCDEIVSRRRAAGNTQWNWNVGVAAPLLKSET